MLRNRVEEVAAGERVDDHVECKDENVEDEERGHEAEEDKILVISEKKKLDS